MTRRINYEDDIFTLTLQVRCLQDTLKLDIDAELFRDRLLGDIAWLDGAIDRLFRSLRESSRYVGRQEHLKELAKLNRAFSGVLDDLVSKRAPFAEHLADRLEELAAVRDGQKRDIEEIKALLDGTPAPEEEHIVSADELRFLMSSEEDSGE